MAVMLILKHLLFQRKDPKEEEKSEDPTANGEKEDEVGWAYKYTVHPQFADLLCGCKM